MSAAFKLFVAHDDGTMLPSGTATSIDEAKHGVETRVGKALAQRAAWVPPNRLYPEWQLQLGEEILGTIREVK